MRVEVLKKKKAHIIRLARDLQVKSTEGSLQLRGSRLLEWMSSVGRKSLGVAAGRPLGPP